MRPVPLLILLASAAIAEDAPPTIIPVPPATGPQVDLRNRADGFDVEVTDRDRRLRVTTSVDDGAKGPQVRVASERLAQEGEKIRPEEPPAPPSRSVLSLDDDLPMVQTPERRPVERERAVVGVDVVPARRDRERGYAANAADRVRLMPGTQVQASNGGIDGGVAGIRLRGNFARFTQVLVDGLPLNDPTASTGDPNLAFLDGSGVDHIEVVRGPQSGLYGSRAVGGVVAVSTLRPTAEPHGRLRGMAGSWGTVGADASATGPLADGLGYAVSGSSLTSDGWSSQTGASARGNPDSHEADGVARRNARARLEWAPAEGLVVYASGAISTVRQEFDGYQAPDDTTYYQEARSQRGALGASWSGGAFEFAADVATTHSRRDIYTPGAGAYLGGETYAQLRGTWKAGDGLTATLGGDGRRQDFKRIEASGAPGVDAHDFLGGAYLQLGHASDWTEVSLTGRQDLHNHQSDHASGRAAAAVFPGTRAVKLRGALADGFRAPSLDEQYSYYDFSFLPWYVGTFSGNPDLKPETVRNAEVGVDVAAAEHLQGSATLFRTWYRNRITYVDLKPDDTSNDTLVMVNERSGSRIDGLETALAWDDPKGPLTLRATYTYLVTIDADHHAFAEVPKHQGGAEATLRQRPANLLLWETLLVERKVGYPTAPASQEQAVTRTATVWGAALGCRWANGWEVAARADNLFNNANEPKPGYTGVPRSYYVSVAAEF